MFWKTSLCRYLLDQTIVKEVIQEKEMIQTKSKLVVLNTYSSETFKNVFMKNSSIENI